VSVIDEIKARLDLVAYISETVPLKKAGRSYKARCPFHQERTPSFVVFPETQHWRCFGACGEGGDIITFAMKQNGWDFNEALAHLAERAGVELRPRTVEQEQHDAFFERMLGLLEETARFYHSLLQEAPQAEVARAYLLRRGLNEQTIMDGSLGYNPGERRDAPELWGFGADHKPVWLPRGITIPWVAAGHVWRVNIRRPEGDPKYAAAAGSATALYRSNTLAPGWAAVLVEGELDALTIWQHAGGIISAVATGSTTAARRPRWLAPLAACDVVLVAFDSDEPGEEAAAYWLNILPKARRWRPYFGKDANGLATSGGDVAAWILDGLGSAPW